MDREQLRFYLNKYKEYKQRVWNAKTARNNAYYFRNLTEFLGNNSLNNSSILGFFNHLQSIGKAESTRRQAETAVIAFTGWLHEEGITKKNYGANIERTKIHRKTRILPSQEDVLKLIERATEPGEYDNVLTRFSKMEHRWCLYFMVVVCGGRNFETSQLLRADVSISGLQIEFRSGKGGPRIQAIPKVPWLIDELKRRVDGKRTTDELHVLSDWSHYKESDKDRLFVVNRTKLEETMRKVGKLWNRSLHVHDLRRIFARDLKNNGADIDDVRDAMGHRSAATTIKYLEYNTATQQKTLKNYSSEARRFRTEEEIAGELVNHAWQTGKVIEGNLKGNVLTLKVEIARNRVS